MNTPELTLKRIHAQRLREVYRSAGWPYQDMVEVELLAAGLLQRITNDSLLMFQFSSFGYLP